MIQSAYSKPHWQYVASPHGVTFIAVINGPGDTSSNPICIWHSANTLGKGMNPTIFLLCVNSRADLAP